MKRRLLHWVVLALLLSVLSAGAAVAVVYWRHTVPLSRCSEVYRRYHDLPGIQAAYIRQMPVNDTLRLDMTIFEAADSVAFGDMLRTMGYREEYIKDMMTLREIYAAREDADIIRFTGECLRGNPGIPADADPAKNEIVSVFPVRMCVALFHTHSEEEMQIVFDKSIYDEIII